jgi:hypothetical protein
VFPDVKSENKLLIYCPFMKKIHGGHMGNYGGHMGKYGRHMGKYGGHMGISLELNFRTYGKIWRTYGKKWRTYL